MKERLAGELLDAAGIKALQLRNEKIPIRWQRLTKRLRIIGGKELLYNYTEQYLMKVSSLVVFQFVLWNGKLL
jgi:hypothetical protein